MIASKIIFYVFAAIATYSSSMVIISKNPVRAALMLILSFITTSAIWILLQAEFLALSLVLVYVGAVMVLFLFVILMLDIKKEEIRGKFVQYLPLVVCVLVFFLILIIYSLQSKFFAGDIFPQKLAVNISNVKLLGKMLFTEYLLAFELAGVVLLVALVSAVALTFRGAQDRKKQDPARQVKVKKADRLKLVRGD